MYQALYRKWRPSVFADVVGQDHITKTLMNEIRTNRHSHAYLFTGSRGTGKTTCAKIFAKAVNCEHPVNGDPCNCCETCKGIDNGSILDVVEIDAASNNGVDNIRDIRDEANFTPVNGNYRVYIIDEVHMLSKGAYNALLKTLEEPPEHVKFILATTEVQALPATILSRCQRFDFKRIRPEDIEKRISYVAEQEGLQLTPEAANLIARLADGALRDALSILDQCIGHGNIIDETVVNDVVGLAGRDYLFALSDAILRCNAAAALTKIGELHDRSCDMERLCNELMSHFRNLMIAKAVKDPRELITCSNQELEAYKATASTCSMDRILEVLDVLSDTLASLRKGLNRRVEMEMAIIRLCNDTPADVPERPVRVAAPVAQVVPAAPVAVAQPAQPEAQVQAQAPASPAAPAEPEAPAEPVAPAPAFEPIPAPTEDEVAASEPEPVFDPVPAPEPDPGPTPEPAAPAEPPEHVSLQEPAADGPVPTNVWNALVREAVTNDRSMIGILSAATPYKQGNNLYLVSDNILLKRLVPTEPHRNAIYEATYTVMGEYLNPVVSETAPETSVAPEAAATEPASQKEEEDPLELWMQQMNSSDLNLIIEE